MAFVATALFIAAALGLLDALYFILVTYRVLPPDTAWVPRFCRMKEEACGAIVDASEARLLGLPNSALGLGWYLLVAAAAGYALVTGKLPACVGLLVVSGVTVLMSAYLAWVLVARLKVPCPLCFLGHGVNATILGLLMVGCF